MKTENNPNGNPILSNERPINLARDSSILILSDGGVILFGLLGQLLLTHALIVEDYGFWVIIIDLVAILSLITSFGAPDVISRDTKRAGRYAKQFVARYIRFQYLIISIVGFLGLVIAGSLKPEILRLGGVLFLAATFQNLCTNYRVVLRALGMASTEGLIRMLERFLVTTGYGVIIYSDNSGLIEFAVAAAFGPFIAWLIARRISAKVLLEVTREPSEGLDLNPNILDVCRSSLPFVLTSGFLVLLYRIDKFVLVGYYSTEAVAVFNIGWLCYFAGNSVTQAIRSMALPEFGSVRGEGRLLTQKLDNAMEVSEWFIVPGFVIGGLVGISILPMIFPEEYFTGELAVGGTPQTVFFCLLAAWGIGLVSAPIFGAVQSSMNPWNYTLSGVASVVINLLFSLALVPRYGVIGASFSTVGASLGTLVVMIAIIKKEVKLSHLFSKLASNVAISISFSISLMLLIEMHLSPFLAVIGIVVVALITGWNPRRILDLSSS